jgi:hypothetical protein
MKTKTLLVATAVVELAAGAALLIVPSFAARLLLGEALGTAVSMLVGRVAGAALTAIGVACWLESAGNRAGSPSGLLAGLLVYNCAVPLLLVHGAVFNGIHGILLWPAVVLHIVLALWCIVLLRRQSA